MRFVLSAVIAACLVAHAFGSEGYFDYRAMSEWPHICQNGKQQSPINIDTDEVTPQPESRGQTDYVTMGTLSKFVVIFTGHCLQVEFKEFAVEANVRIPANEFKIGNSSNLREGELLAIEPVQMHLHTLSEHTLDGFYAPAELHLVTRVKDGESDYCDASGGCLAVFGVFLTYEKRGNKNNYVLKDLFQEMPEGQGMGKGIVYKHKLNLDDLLPKKKNYYTYLGSLTTPPCREIVTWHIYPEPIPVAAELIEMHQHMVSFTPGDDCTFVYSGVCSPPREKTNHRPIQQHNGRMVYFVDED